MEKTAKLIKDNLPSRGYAALYRLDPPMRVTDFDEVTTEHSLVVVSAVNVIFSGPETYIFPADEDGNVTDYGELDGSYRGGLDHAVALGNAGYKVVP